MLNHIALQGRCCDAPELRYTQNQVPVATFTLAVEQDYAQQGEKRKADFIPVVAWRGAAEFASKFFTKGSMAIVSGRLQIREYTDRDGNKRKAAEVVADNIYFGESKKRDDNFTPAGRPVDVDPPAEQSRFRELNGCDDDELPFA